MRSASACVLAGWLGVFAWACAQAPPEGFTDDEVDAGRSEAGELVDKADARLPDDAGDVDAARGDDAAGMDAGADVHADGNVDADAHVDVDAGIDAGTCTKVGASKTCGLSPQCGCSPNETCDLNAHADTVCIGPAGLNTEGNACTNTGSCALGLTCAFADACHRFCSNPGQSCGPDAGLCVQMTDSQDAAIANFAVCEIKCHLEDPNACGAGAACFPSQFSTGSDCARTGTVGLDAGCMYLDDCQAGLACVGPPNAQAYCKKWCRIGQNGDCGGQACGALNPALVINGVTYGSCP